jgi:hypothetical protein
LYHLRQLHTKKPKALLSWARGFWLTLNEAGLCVAGSREDWVADLVGDRKPRHLLKPLLPLQLAGLAVEVAAEDSGAAEEASVIEVVVGSVVVVAALVIVGVSEEVC